ncbi:hypothetical protein [Roseateles sp. PN1]|uniref:hypothetical protein n=1 Tax=Roseateles sp. PN1 TaxID=3137372 RepID=UPI003138A0A8
MATQAQQQKQSGQVKIGFADGVEVIGAHATEQYMIETPNNYEIYFPLLKSNGAAFCTREDSQDPSRAVFSLKITSQADIKALNEKVAMARTTHREIETERKDFQDILSFDLMEKGKTVAFMYRPPDHHFSTGEIVRTGKYFVAQHCGSNEEKVFVRMINSSRFLQGEEFRNRDEVMRNKFPEGTDSWNPQEGRPKYYFAWGRDSKIEIRPYAPKLYSEPQQAKGAEQPNEQQKAALLAYVQANGISWKRSLGLAWETGDYKSTPKEHQGLLQQVRNQFGPEWLRAATVNSLGSASPQQDKPEATQKTKAAQKPDPAKPEGTETPAKKPAAKTAKATKEVKGPVASM